MTPPRIGRTLLQLRLALSRYGTGPGLASLLCIAGALCWLWWVPHEQAQVDSQRAALQAERMAQRVVPGAPRKAVAVSGQERLAAFYATLGDRHRTERQLLTLFEKARESGLTLAKGEYKVSYDSNSQVYSYQVLLPVNGSYSAIRRFCEKTLLAIPFASLDEISFRRDLVGNGTLDARLRFTLHLKEAPPSHPAPGVMAMRSDKP
ncbi:hypothetical protein RA280_14110 [Cupriavidus sp. CV2]|uniref:hypothetical protein n=1 Tax=Cupriavidus ulmosensis TaxID=3065913 RepID=UPI00296AA5FF|nr:hypothetical protein [Cupriavidus sp. CV2]MDW3682860.1 hypothetical protein [Cupriavidus sp. CV2]